MKKNKVVLLSQDVIGKKMAGAGIRYFELAKTLSKKHDVILLTPNEPDLTASFPIERYAFHRFRKLLPYVKVILSQRLSPTLGMLTKLYRTAFILDAYDPEPFEYLELSKSDSLYAQTRRLRRCLHRLKFGFQLADGMICANEKQKDLWLGFVMGRYGLTPEMYSNSSFIQVVPFGMSSTPPKASGPSLRKQYRIPDHGKLLLWGGGIWDWFDPLTLIKACNLLNKKRKDIYLCFLGIQHPSPTVPAMQMTQQAIDLSKEYDLFEKNIFFSLRLDTL